jgi:hypothetical protein
MMALLLTNAANRAAASDPKPISIFSFRVSHFARPRTPIMDASVTINGGMPSSEIVAPFNVPISAAAKQATPTPHAACQKRWAPPGRVSSVATSDVASANVLPTLKSIPAVKITNVMGSAMIPMTDTCRRMSVRLPVWRKIFDPSCAIGLNKIAVKTIPASAATLFRRRSQGNIIVRVCWPIP